jgi:hypothetical protein
MALWAGYGLLAWLVTVVIFGALSRGMMPGEVPVAIGLVYGSFAATLGLPLLLVRSRGYRLTFAKERRR